MSKRPRAEKATDISSLIEKILASKGLDKTLQKYRAWTIWDDVVGPQIAKNAQPLRIRESILEVRVAHATWMQQLQLLKPKILKELNERLGENALSDIYWKRGEIQPAPENKVVERIVPLPELTPEKLNEINKLTEDIHDLELQSGLKHLLEVAEKHNQLNGSD